MTLLDYRSGGDSKCLLLLSGLGLGHYMPGLIMRARLAAMGFSAHFLVYEDLLSDQHKARLSARRQRYQADSRMANLGQKLHLAGVFDEEKIALSESCQWFEQSNHIVILSGQWCAHIPQRQHPKVTLLHVDTGESPSWQVASQHVRTLLASGARELWLSMPLSKQGRLVIGDGRPPVSWGDREASIVAHGGGWALGNFNVALDLLTADRGLRLHLLAGTREGYTSAERMSLYTMPSEWSPWGVSPDRPFPPLLRKEGNSVVTLGDGHTHAAFELARRSLAVISKPGGMVLNESLVSATPVVFLEPYGCHEQENAAKWIGAGFGLWFSDWAASGYSLEPLRTAHERLLSTDTVDCTSLILG